MSTVTIPPFRGYIGVGPWEPYKFLDPACFVFADSDAYLIAWILDVVRLRVSHIYPPHLSRQFRLGAQIVSTFLDGCPLGQSLDPAIASVAHEDSTFGSSLCVEHTKLARSVTG